MLPSKQRVESLVKLDFLGADKNRKDGEDNAVRNGVATAYEKPVLTGVIVR